MSGATNKDFSEGEVRSIIMGDSARVWSFIGILPEYIECLCNLVVGCYYTFTYIGRYGFLVLLDVVLLLIIGYIRGSMESTLDKEKRVKHDQRMAHINESFHNIKGIKIQGWEDKFLQKIEAIHQEELALEDRALYRDMFYDFV